MRRPPHDVPAIETKLARGGVPDAELMDDLVRRYWHPLVAYASRLLGDVAAAEDVVPQGFLRLWERKHVVPSGDEARPFLYKVVRNLAANEWR